MKKVLLLILILVGFLNSIAQTYNIGHTTILFNDAARGNRNIQTEIYYPAVGKGENTAVAGIAGQQFPLIVFGHGESMSSLDYENIWTAIVPQGYIVVFPRSEENGDPDAVNFSRDLSFLVNAMQGQSAMGGNIFSGKLSSKSCVMGHSRGGGCAVLAGKYNPNITAIAGLAPIETDPSALSAADRIFAASLIFAGSNDFVAPAAENSLAIYNALGSNCKTFISITKGNHCQFANYNANCTGGENLGSPSPSVTRTIQQSVTMRFLLPWLNYKLKNNCESWFTLKEELETAIDITYKQSCANAVTCIGPSNRLTTDITLTSARLKWKPVSCVSTYELRYKPASASAWVNVGTVGSLTSYALTGLSNGTSYDWMVRTVCDDDATLNSGWGAKKTFTTASLKDAGYETLTKDENEFIITPNPSNGKFLVTASLNDFTPVSILVYNCIGRKISESNVKPKEQELAQAIDISNEPSGLYFVRINCGDQVDTQRIIKK